MRNIWQMTQNRGLTLLVLLMLWTVTGCSVKSAPSAEEPPSLEIAQEPAISSSAEEQPTLQDIITTPRPPTQAILDWSNYFGNLNGAAVIYDPLENHYQIYNLELALTQRSPCSTFKIVSSLTALEHGIIDPDHSVRTWSGETFWNEKWNQDMEFQQAFRTSCVWYFRTIIDEIGKENMQEALNRLSYGNCDLSDWEGQLNTNNSNPALTGFWIESSLKISPKEQTEVMERIFGDHSSYSETTRNQLTQVMSVPETEQTQIRIYGKTGMGKEKGVVADSWFTGFADVHENRIYFCVYLGETKQEEVSSQKAKEIAIRLVSDYSR